MKMLHMQIKSSAQWLELAELNANIELTATASHVGIHLLVKVTTPLVTVTNPSPGA